MRDMTGIPATGQITPIGVLLAYRVDRGSRSQEKLHNPLVVVQRRKVEGRVTIIVNLQQETRVPQRGDQHQL